MSECKKYKIRDLSVKITKGTTPTTLGLPFVKQGINFIKAEALTFDGQIDSTKFMFISHEANEKLKRSIIEEGDILFSMAGMVLGKSAVVKKHHLPANTNQALAIIRLNAKLALPIFVDYYIRQKSFFDYVNNSTGQSAQPNINLEEIGNLEIALPSLPTQTLIATILSSLDDKIELNRQTNKTLEQIAQTLFKEMCVPKGDELPEGWERKLSSSLFDVKDGTHDSPKPTEDGYHLITSKHLKDSGVIDFAGAYKISSEDYSEINKRSKVNTFDILYSMIGTIGNLLIVDAEKVEFAIKNIGLFKTSQREDLVYFFYLFLKTEESKQYLRERQSGSTQQYVTLKTLREIPVLLPEEKVIVRFNKQIIPIFTKIKSNNLEIDILTNIRNLLLPKLMKGEIKV